MSLLSFVTKYADEAFAVGKALTSILEGLALSPKQADNVNEAIAKLEKAHDEINKYLNTKPKDTVVKISKADIEAAVKATMQPMIDKAVKDAVNAAIVDDGK